METLELWYAVESFCYRIAVDLAMGDVLYRFTRPFVRRVSTARRAGIAYFAAMRVLDYMPLMIGNFLAYFLGVFVAFLVLVLAEREHCRRKIFLAVTFFSLRWMAWYMVNICMEAPTEAVISMSYMGGDVVLRFWSFVGVFLLRLLLAFGILRLCTGLIAKPYRNSGEDMTTEELLMLITPSVAGMSGYWIMRYYQSYIEDTMAAVLSGYYRGVAILHYGVWMATIVVVAVLFEKIRAKQEELLRDEMLREQMDGMQRHIRQVETFYRDIRGLKHDMANHIQTMGALYAKNEGAAAKEYAKAWEAALQEADGGIASGNPITDVILREWKEEAKKRGIVFSCAFRFPEDTRINAFDVSILLNNALQNAIEYCDKKDGELRVRSYRRNNAFLIEISNPFSGELRWDKEHALPLTSKEAAGGRAHGYGLYNMKKVAEDYAGTIEAEAEGGVFRLSIMLMAE